MKTNWEFDNYYVQLEDHDHDLKKFGFYTNEHNLLGYLCPDTIEDMEDTIAELNDDADPIEEGWNDGLGNTVNIEGWGNEK